MTEVLDLFSEGKECESGKLLILRNLHDSCDKIMRASENREEITNQFVNKWSIFLKHCLLDKKPDINFHRNNYSPNPT